MNNLSVGTRKTLSVVSSGVVGAVVTPGAVFCFEKFTPGFASWLKGIFAKHIVEPHLDLFEKVSVGIERSRQAYDDRKRGELIREGKSVEIEKPVPLSRTEHAARIADDMVAALAGLGAAYVTTLFSQRGFNKLFGVEKEINPRTVAGIELVSTSIAAVLMPTLFAKPAEDLHHNIRRRLERRGMEKDHADNVGVSVAYGVIPDIIATICSLIYAQRSQGVTKH